MENNFHNPSPSQPLNQPPNGSQSSPQQPPQPQVNQPPQGGYDQGQPQAGYGQQPVYYQALNQQPPQPQVNQPPQGGYDQGQPQAGYGQQPVYYQALNQQPPQPQVNQPPQGGYDQGQPQAGYGQQPVYYQALNQQPPQPQVNQPPQGGYDQGQPQAGYGQQMGYDSATYSMSDPPTPPVGIKQVKKSFSTCALGLLGLMLVGILFAGIVDFSMPQETISGELRTFLVYAFMYIPGIPVMKFILKKAPQPEQPLPQTKAVGFKSMLKIILINNSVLVFMMIFSSIISIASAQPINDDGYIGSVARDPFTAFFSLVIFAPLIEEFVIRRSLYPHLYQYGATPFVIFSTILFSFMHVNSGQLLTTVPMGILTGLLMYYSGNFIYGVILHSVSNLASYILFAVIGNSYLLTLYLFIQAPLMLAGIIIAIIWWVKELRHKKLAPAQASFMPGFNITRAAILNKGTIAYLICLGLMIIFNMQ